MIIAFINLTVLSWKYEGGIEMDKKASSSFATVVKKVLLRIADSFVSFGKNPLRTTRMMADMIGVALLKPFVFVYNRVVQPVYRHYERDLEEVKMRPAEESLERMSIGTGVLLVLLFFALYLIAMLVHGWLSP